MLSFEEYSTRFQTIRMERDADGILLFQLHSGGGAFQWGLLPHKELGEAFRFVGADRGNRVIIFTGTGATFTAPEARPETRSIKVSMTSPQWDVAHYEARQMLMGELDIEVPMIAAINGPCYRRAELPLLCDITIASDDALFEDAAHFKHGNLMPGDGMYTLYSILLGINRARYLCLTGQRLSAQEAHQHGLVNEVLPKADVLPRAWTLARELAKKSDLLLRYSRQLMTQKLKKEMLENLGYGMALEGLQQLDPSDPLREKG